MEHFPLDLNNEEKKAYEMLLIFGQLSKGELSQYANIDFEVVNSLIKTLEEKGLSTQISTLGNKVMPKFPFLKTHEHFKELCDQINATDQESKNFFADRNTDLEQFKSSKNDEITKFVQERIESFNHHSSELQTRVNTTIKEFDEELDSIEKDFTSNIDSKHDSNVETEKSKVSAKEEVFHGKSNLNQEKILGTVLEHKNELNSITDKFTSSLQVHSTGFLNDAKLKLLELLESFREDLTKFETDYDTSGKEWTQNSLNVQMEAYSVFSNSLDEIFSTISTQLEEQENAVNNFSIDGSTNEDDSPVTSYLNSVSGAFVKYKEDLTKGLDSSKEKYTQDRDSSNNKIVSFKEDTTQKINDFSSNYLSNLDSNFSSFKEQIGSTVETNKVDVNGFYNSLNSDFSKLEKDRTGGLAVIKSDMENQQKIALELQKTTLHDLDNAILLPFNTQFEEIDKNKKNFFKEIKKATESHYKALDTKINELSLAFKIKYDEFTEITQRKSDDAMQKANKEFDNFLKAEQKIFSKNIKDLNKPVPKMKENTEKQVNEFKSMFTDNIGFLSEGVQAQFESVSNVLDEIQKSFINDFSTDLKNIVDSTDDENPKVSKLDLMIKIKEKIDKKKAEVEKTLLKSKSELDSKLLQPYNSQKTELNERVEKLLSTITTSADQHYASITQNLDDIESKLQSKSEDFNKKVSKSIESSFTKLKGDYKKFVKEQYKTTDEYFKEEQKKTLPSNKNIAIDQIKGVDKIYAPELKRLKSVISTFSDSSHELLSTLDTVIITGIPDNLNNNISRTSEEIVKNSKNSQESLSKFKNDWLASLETLNNSLDGFNDTNKNQHSTEIGNIKIEALSLLDNQLSSSQSFNDLTHEYSSNHVQMDHDNFQELLKNSLVEIQTGLLNVVKEQQKLNKEVENQKFNSFTTQEKQIQDRYTGISEKLASIVTTFKETSQTRVNDRDSEVNQIHQEFTTKTVKDTDTFNSSFKSEIGQTITKHEDDYKNHHGDLKSNATEFLQEIENDVISFSDGVRNDATERMNGNSSLLKEKSNYVRAVHDHFESSVQEANSTANNLKENLIENVNSQYLKLISGNKEFSNELQTTVTKGLAILTPKITILEDFERMANSYDFPKITSLPVIGRGGALDIIDLFLSNFKSSVTLLIPNPADVPYDLISQTKRPKRVTVASMFNVDDPIQKEKIKKLIEQDNVTVRMLDPMHYRGEDSEFPSYLSADKDSEETFFGAFDIEEKAEFAGLVSQNRTYIELIGKVLVSDFLTRAKKIDSI